MLCDRRNIRWPCGAMSRRCTGAASGARTGMRDAVLRNERNRLTAFRFGRRGMGCSATLV
jgi:hypothetical protein